MPISIKDSTYYVTRETCQEIGISRATLSRWLKAGVLAKTIKDRRGWRLFTRHDIDVLRSEATRVTEE